MADPNELNYTLDALHAEAGKWRRLSGRMEAVVRGLDRLVLDPNAFFFPDMVSTTAHAQAYNDFFAWQRTLLTAAVEEFGQLGDALDRAADLAESTDDKSAGDLRKIFGTQGAD